MCLCGVVGVALLSATPAMAQNDANNRIKRLENEIETLSRAVYKGEKPQVPMGGGVNDATANIDARISQIEKDLQTLTGKVEQQSYDSQQTQQKLEGLEQEVRMRLDAIEGQLRAGGAQTPPSPMMQQQTQQQPPVDPNVVIGSDQPPMPSALQPETPASDADNSSAGSMDAAGLYEQGFAEIKREDYAAAEKSFAQFMKEYPTHALAPNALYWLGETFYVRKDYDKAARAFAEAYQKYPNGPKGADNLLKLGMSLAGKGEKDSACVALAQLRKEYPKGPEPVLKRGESERATLGCP